MLTQQERKDIFAGANAIITGDHFVYAKKADGWYHGTDYVNKDAVYPDEDCVSPLCRDIAEHFANASIETVVGPTVGGVSLSQWTMHWLRNLPHIGRQKIHAVCADEEDVLEEKQIIVSTSGGLLGEFSASGAVKIEAEADHLGHFGSQIKITFSAKIGSRRVIKRGYGQFVKGRRCLIVEDVANTGLTLAKTRDAVLEEGGTIVGAGCLCNRSGGKVTAQTLCVPELFSLLDLDMRMYPEADCPTCIEKGRGSVRLDLGKGKEFLARMGIKPGDK